MKSAGREWFASAQHRYKQRVSSARSVSMEHGGRRCREWRPLSMSGAWRKKYLRPEELLAVVEASTVEQLPQQLDCRRGAESFQRGHVDVVDEERHAPVEWWAQ